MKCYAVAAVSIVLIISAVGIVSFGNKICTQHVSSEDSLTKSSSSHNSTITPPRLQEQSTPLQARKGLPKTAPSQIYLLGERNSGTKFVEALLAGQIDKKHTRLPESKPVNASDPSTIQLFGNAWTLSSKIPLFHLKHMFRHHPLNATDVAYLQDATDLLWVLVVRNPCDWADAMYRTPWHLCPTKEDDADRCPGPFLGLDRTAVHGKSRLEFFRDMEWRDWHESTIDPNDFTYDSVFDLRRHKLSLMKQLMTVSPHRFQVVHLDQVELQPELFVQHFVKQFGLQAEPDPSPMKAKHHKTLCLNADEWKVAQEKIDWTMEAHFGFVPTNCHMCY
eukprot:CAMPEP_0119004750 /NCGR_PEP_ID=MMETSP1176-20130426/1329_1 /TAXON_ID=265551 /ORGANISM="Synedropsis recta cf, Strain CCMP1620" /LENGTH=333 /DNA_ID=CAMNT_0006956495 /DNA_START=109 /DNA_END=1110 /DNA_ORIENTATION=-